MFNSKMPKVEILKAADVSAVPWCDSAVLFSVKNGKGTLGYVYKETKDYDTFVQLSLNNRPLLQGKYPGCPTCKGMLATGYGIENIDCPELKAVSEAVNADYKDIHSSAQTLKPLLGLLDDGIYLLADVEYSPTDGNGRFFHSVPNELTLNDALCDTYLTEEYDSVDGFPTYLYPTQSAAVCNPQRVEEYVNIFRDNPNPPRGIAYYEKGFISALLDGHHKACAAVLLGIKLNCLTIMRADRAEFANILLSRKKARVKNVFFAGIKIPAKKGERMCDYGFGFNYTHKSKTDFTEYSLTGRSFRQEELSARKNYLTVDQLCGLISFNLYADKITDAEVSEWIENPNDENCAKLKYMLPYLMVNDRTGAYELAKRIICCERKELPRREAWRALVEFRTDETEQMVIDYFVEHNKDDKCWDVVSLYCE